MALELLLRHRAKRVITVWPPGLMVKWQDEMAEKFGLDSVIVDSAQLNALRRSHRWPIGRLTPARRASR